MKKCSLGIFGILLTLFILPFTVGEASGQTLREEAFELQLPQGTLHGTLEIPDVAAPCPVVLIIAGSGPTDRNGNNPYGVKANYLKMFADGLAQQGIASLRYDKRAIGESRFNIKESDVTFENFVQDADALLTKLKQDKRFSKVFIAGHSEGSLIGTLAAQQQPIDGLICLAGPGRPLSEIILRQIKEHQPQMYDSCAPIVAQLEQGTPVSVTDPDLQPLFRPSVQPFLISLFRYNPAVELGKVKSPVLIVQGTHDLQIQNSDATALQQANPQAKLVTIDGMNHALKTVPDDMQANIAAYSDPKKPLAAQLMPAVIDFIKQVDAN